MKRNGILQVLFFFLLTFSVGLNATAAGSELEDVLSNYTKQEVMLPMRDGVRLYTVIYSPSDSTLNSPVLVNRTPYSLAPYGDLDYIALDDYLLPYVQANYILVFQNVRGTMMSEGDFVHIRPVLTQRRSKETDEVSDTYDTVDWLVAHTHNNGNVGFMGVSYNGFYSTIAAICKHPAIKAVSPQAPVTDWFMGDDIHINGAFCNSIYSFGASMFRNRPHPVAEALPALVKPEGDYYSYFIEKASIDNLFNDFGDSLEFFNQIRKHPDYDDFWQVRNPLNHIHDVIPAVMVVGGWYDREDLYGTLATYKALLQQSPETQTYLVMAPWKHGSWNHLDYNHMSGTWFGEGSSIYFHNKILFNFFEKYLNGKEELQLAKVYYLPSSETEEEQIKGKSSDAKWKTAAIWPLDDMVYRKYYLTADKRLDEVKPVSRTGLLSYISNPDRPVSCTGDKMESWAADEATGDQSYLTWRSDVLSFVTEELVDTLKVAGPLSANISISSSTTDADLIVKLIDVRPDGYQMLVRWTVLPLRYRNSFSKPEPLVPGRKQNVKVQMDDIAHYFVPGHKLMVQIQSSMFPWITMSPQQFMENPYYASRKDYQPAEIKIYCNRTYYSYISLPVVE